MKTVFNVNPKELKLAMDNCKVATSKDKYRQEWQKIKLELNRGSLKFIALDGYRLHTNIITAENNNNYEPLEILVEHIKVPTKAKFCEITIDEEQKTITYDFITEKTIKQTYSTENFPKNDIIENIIKDHNSNFKIGINRKYLIAALEKWEDDVVVLDFDSKIKPLIIKKQGQNDNINIVLPVRLKEDQA